MTIPYLMNCSHTGDGWCLACVKKLGEECESMREQIHEDEEKRILSGEALNIADVIVGARDALDSLSSYGWRESVEYDSLKRLHDRFLVLASTNSYLTGKVEALTSGIHELHRTIERQEERMHKICETCDGGSKPRCPQCQGLGFVEKECDEVASLKARVAELEEENRQLKLVGTDEEKSETGVWNVRAYWRDPDDESLHFIDSGVLRNCFTKKEAWDEALFMYWDSDLDMIHAIPHFEIDPVVP